MRPSIRSKAELGARGRRLPCRPGQIGCLVPQQGHGILSQGRDGQASHFSGAHRPEIPIQDFEDVRVVGDVHPAVRAFHRGLADLRQPVDLVGRARKGPLEQALVNPARHLEGRQHRLQRGKLGFAFEWRRWPGRPRRRRCSTGIVADVSSSHRRSASVSHPGNATGFITELRNSVRP